MEINIGKNDKLIRVLIGGVIVALYSQKILTGSIGYIALGLATSVLITAFFRKSPLYSMLNFSTLEEE